ncbi:hypothetical protein CUMW_040880 [Citrus unshiu]|nr:hypothetical protein CUMW_040880 [Citrus unshiu]
MLERAGHLIPIFNTQKSWVSDSLTTLFDYNTPIPNEVLTNRFESVDDVINASEKPGLSNS